ncbi:MAG: hypothetical protein PVF17_00495 [Ignavibacteria bacterium]
MSENISEEEERRRIDFMLEEHECQGALNAKTWLTPGYHREFWLIVNNIYTWINYCPYCGYKPEKPWW